MWRSFSIENISSRCGNTGKGTAWLDSEIWHAWLGDVKDYWKRARQNHPAYREAQLIILADGVNTHGVDESMEAALENEGISVHIKAAYMTSARYLAFFCELVCLFLQVLSSVFLDHVPRIWWLDSVMLCGQLVFLATTKECVSLCQENENCRQSSANGHSWPFSDHESTSATIVPAIPRCNYRAAGVLGYGSRGFS